MIYTGQATNADQVINKLYQRRKRHPDAEVYHVTARDLDILFDYIQSTDDEIRHITESHNVLENKLQDLTKQYEALKTRAYVDEL